MKAVQARNRIAFKNILYATDFSPASAAALPYALEFAKQYGARLHGLRVRMPTPGWFIGAEAFSQLIITERELAKRDEDRLDALMAEVPHDVTVEEGDIWAPLSNLIEQKDIDLLVIGSHGRTGVSKAILGSIAAEIFRCVSCPVLTVGPHVKGFDAGKLKLEEILYPVDFSAASLAASPYAISLAQENQARLTLLTVAEDSSAGTSAPPQMFAEAAKRRQQELVPPDAELWCKPESLVRAGNAAEQILKTARLRAADLIVLGVKEARGALTTATHLARATAQDIVAKAHCPVLTVRHSQR